MEIKLLGTLEAIEEPKTTTKKFLHLSLKRPGGEIVRVGFDKNFYQTLFLSFKKGDAIEIKIAYSTNGSIDGILEIVEIKDSLDFIYFSEYRIQKATGGNDRVFKKALRPINEF